MRYNDEQSETTGNKYMDNEEKKRQRALEEYEKAMLIMDSIGLSEK